MNKKQMWGSSIKFDLKEFIRKGCRFFYNYYTEEKDTYYVHCWTVFGGNKWYIRFATKDKELVDSLEYIQVKCAKGQNLNISALMPTVKKVELVNCDIDVY